jgi:hypothetical protein
LTLFDAYGNVVERDYDDDGRASFDKWVRPGTYRLVLSRWGDSTIDYSVRLKFRVT